MYSKTESMGRILNAAVICIFVISVSTLSADNGTWIATGTGDNFWGDSDNWQGGIIADGQDYTANFNADSNSSVGVTAKE